MELPDTEAGVFAPLQKIGGFLLPVFWENGTGAEGEGFQERVDEVGDPAEVHMDGQVVRVGRDILKLCNGGGKLWRFFFGRGWGFWDFGGFGRRGFGRGGFPSIGRSPVASRQKASRQHQPQQQPGG